VSEALILSAYDGQSHRYWRQGLTQFLADERPEISLTEVTLPARHFSWRQRGNSLSFALHPALQRRYDLMIVTSLTDLSALRGMNRHLANVPAIVYFHENQFAYPDRHPQGLLERQVTSIYTAISGEQLVFNSEWNRRSFLEGAQALLAKMPDEVPHGIVAALSAKSMVLPVALDMPASDSEVSHDVPRIVWNHRWEHDKGPELLKQIVTRLLASGRHFSMSLLGQRFASQPEGFEQVEALLASSGRLGVSGYLEDRDAYLACLSEHNRVLSTASQEFQGLAVQEAILCGCTPVVPDDLSYPEYVPDSLRFGNVEEAVEMLLRVPGTGVDLADYTWEVAGPQWLALIDASWQPVRPR
jgi:hypothetical protein